jgi:hypothetical protein
MARVRCGDVDDVEALVSGQLGVAVVRAGDTEPVCEPVRTFLRSGADGRHPVIG